jgi:hypothetical protein
VFWYQNILLVKLETSSRSALPHFDSEQTRLVPEHDNCRKDFSIWLENSVDRLTVGTHGSENWGQYQCCGSVRVMGVSIIALKKDKKRGEVARATSPIIRVHLLNSLCLGMGEGSHPSPPYFGSVFTEL